MRMMGHRRAPSMEHGGDADAGAEMLWIGSDGEQCLGRRAEQQIIDHRLVLVGDRGDLGRQGEDHVEVADREQVGLARCKPVLRRCALALGAMAVAAGNGRCPLPALWANFVMLSRRAALQGSTWDSGSLALHYDLSLSMAMSLSGGRKKPLRRCGGTMASMASSFSLGSPRV